MTSTVQTTERFVELGGVRLFVREAGSGPRTIVLHGGPGAHHDYLLPQFDLLARGRTLVHYDQRGGGQSPVPRETNVTWQSHVDDLLRLLDLFEEDRASIAGYSWGGLLAMLFAVSHPDRVSRLALISPAPATAAGRRRFEERFTARMADPSIADARRALQHSGLRETDPEAYRQRAFELSVAGYFSDPTQSRSLTPFRITGRVQTSVWQSLGEYDIRNQLAGVNVPAVVVHGEDDPIPVDTARETASLLDAELHVLPRCGHVPYVEQTETFVRILDEFLP